MNFYLKYRPRTIDELDLAGVRESLGQIVKANKLAHAYLFTGPRGAGKTSAARILARVVNCEKNKGKLGEPCNECAACQEILAGSALDVIEIDAASNRGIDDIRELKEKIRLAPVSLPYKVYIIDEVHMLTTEAFNALLKTLEEPPAHSIFILCTTELHKVPETIVSRCVRVNFYKASKDELARSFARVLLGEEMVIADEILGYIGSQVDGSFRDGVKILEQVVALGSKVTLPQVEQILSGGVGYRSEEWVEKMLVRDTASALEVAHKAWQGGVDLTFFLVTAMQTLRAGLLAPYKLEDVPASNFGVSKEEGIKLVYKLDEVAKAIGNSPMPELLVEAMIIEWGEGNQSSSKPAGQQASGSVGQRTSEPAAQQVSGSRPKADQPLAGEKLDKQETILSSRVEHSEIERSNTIDSSTTVGMTKTEEEIVKDQMMDGATIRSLWRKMLSAIPDSQYSLEALLTKAKPVRVDGRNLTVAVAYDFHKTQLETTRFREAVESLVKQTYGMPLLVSYELGKGDTMVEVGDDLVTAAEEIFVN